jgi:fatty acid desaturase
MPARRIPAHEFLTQGELAELRQRRTWRGLWMIAHAWGLIAASIALVAIFPNPFTFILAVMIIGSRQLGLAILMHDGAHGALARDEKLNLFLSQYFCAYPVLAETRAYRRYHMAHHAHTQQQDDPDLALSAPFPVTQASLKRKFLRDITGRTALTQRRAQFAAALGDPSWPLAQRLVHYWDKLGPQTLANVLLAGAMAAAGVWWAYPLLWVLPLMTWYMVVTRMRNIAEHAVVPDHDDPLRNTRTTKANWIERLLIAPYFVNYHLEHHLLFYVPCYNLPKAHAALMRKFADRMEVQPNYRAVLQMAGARPATQDMRGARYVDRLKERQARASDDRTSGGF